VVVWPLVVGLPACVPVNPARPVTEPRKIPRGRVSISRDPGRPPASAGALARGGTTPPYTSPWGMSAPDRVSSILNAAPRPGQVKNPGFSTVTEPTSPECTGLLVPDGRGPPLDPSIRRHDGPEPVPGKWRPWGRRRGGWGISPRAGRVDLGSHPVPTVPRPRSGPAWRLRPPVSVRCPAATRPAGPAPRCGSCPAFGTTRRKPSRSQFPILIRSTRRRTAGRPGNVMPDLRRSCARLATMVVESQRLGAPLVDHRSPPAGSRTSRLGSGPAAMPSQARRRAASLVIAHAPPPGRAGRFRCPVL